MSQYHLLLIASTLFAADQEFFLKVVYNVRTNTIIIFCRSNHHHPGPDSGLDFAADARSVQTNIFHHCTVICFINQKVFLARMCLLPLI